MQIFLDEYAKSAERFETMHCGSMRIDASHCGSMRINVKWSIGNKVEARRNEKRRDEARRGEADQCERVIEKQIRGEAR